MLIREDKKIQTNDITLHTAFQHEKFLISQDWDTGYYDKEYDGFCVKSDNHKTSIIYGTKIIVMGRDMQAQLHTYIAQLRPYIISKVE